MAEGDSYRTQPNFVRTALWLGLFVVLAFAMRSAFVIPVDTDPETGRHLFTGNDPYYHWRTATHVVETGSNLDSDKAISYPEGRDNPNPPLWTWTSAVVAVTLKALHVGGPDFVGTALDIMVAVWGALCVIPIYMIGKDLWGRRAGLWGALFMAISAPHIQRSIWGYADHDAISMFFILLAFAFIVRALKLADLREHVAHWNRASAIGSGLRDAVLRNRDTLVYAALAGISVTACAVVWKGYPYVFGIIAVAAFFQLVLDHLRNRDSTVTWMVYTTVIAIGTLLPWLLYYQFQPYQMHSTVDPSLYVLYGVLLLGLVLVPTRDLPSILVFPALLIGAILGAVFLMKFQPNIWYSITSGLGYFQQSKLYSTIAEAQRPQLGEVAATLGFFTFLLAFWGLFRTLRMGVKGDGPNILVASWAIVAIFMMFAAARFEVNAAPLFCVLLGFTLDRIVAFMGLDDVRKRFRSQHGQNPVWRSLRSLSWKSATIAIAIALFLVLPNLWLGVDAAIPHELKSTNDQLKGMDNYSSSNRDPKTGNWYSTPRLGAFGISFDDIAGGENWVQVMNGLAKRDTCWSSTTKVCQPGDSDYRVQEDRPAFVGWWDYGHWAVAVGMHPTVADPFQSHYELSGRVLASDSEEEAMSWLTILLIRGDRVAHDGQPSAEVRDLLQRTDPDLLQIGAAGWYADDYKVLQANLNNTDIFHFYDSVCAAAHKCVGYLGVSARMYPVGGSGIFYAPVFLADKNPDDYVATRLQVTFPNQQPKILTVHQYEMVDNHSVRLDKAKFTEEGQNGQVVQEYVEYQGYLYPKGQTPLQGYAPTSGAQYDPARAQQSQPTGKFEGSFFARAFGNTIVAGSRNAQGQDVGQPSGDGLSHWRPIAETSTQQSLSSDGSPVKARGVVLLAYYKGAHVNGTLLDDAQAPMPGYVVTVRDGMGGTHGRATTDAAGHFTVAAPFSQAGDLKLQVYSPTYSRNPTAPLAADKALLSDSRAEIQFTPEETDAGASRLVTLTMQRGNLTGFVYEEKNGNATYEAGTDSPLGNVTVALSGGRHATTDASGHFTIDGLQPNEYTLNATKAPEYGTVSKVVTIPTGGSTEVQVGMQLAPATVHATFQDENGTGVADLPVLFTPAVGAPKTVQTNATGVATAPLVPGAWSLSVDKNVTTLPDNATAPVTVHYVGHATVVVARGEKEATVVIRQGS